ncbi:MAG: hypothetical protein KIT80_04820 [Chitinophagaceae bacterium]|nr:hypothetical protein [Chitinophagaceae bacterium]MCW5926215.1 hypothetical protein [Chitinophagaceae bacterium]
MKKLKTIIAISSFACLLLAMGCEKNTTDPGESDDDDDNPNNPITYSFTNPVNIRIESISSNGSGSNILSKTQIVDNYIYSTFPRSINSNNYSEFIKKTPIGISNYVTTGFEINPGSYQFVNQNASNKYAASITVSLFTIDKKGEHIYIFNTKRGAYSPAPDKVQQIYKGNLSTGTTTEIIPTGNIAQLNFLQEYSIKCMRVDDLGNVYIASVANNGCIVKVSSSGQITQLATGLINPGYFDIHNGSLYVPIDLATGGKIVKIDANSGNLSNVITNLTGPANVVIDNYGNIVVRSLTTVDGGNYHRYDIYKPTGDFISNIQDINGYSILSDIYENMPMYIDADNNLYFYHADDVSSGGYTSNNPKGQKGIFKIGVIKN